VLVTSGGSDFLAGSGTAKKVDGGYHITARKIFSSGSPGGDVLMTMAVYDDPTDGPTVLHFPIPLSSPGGRRVAGFRSCSWSTRSRFRWCTPSTSAWPKRRATLRFEKLGSA
jgi:hypothetical protein